MRRTTVFLSDELDDRLRHEAFEAKVSMVELIHLKLQAPAANLHRKDDEDPILKSAGVCRDPVLSSDIDESLYGG
jgi:hypothetical protein